MIKKLLLLFFVLSSLDLYQINTRRSYYPPPLGQIFQNKFTQTALNIRKHLFAYARFIFP